MTARCRHSRAERQVMREGRLRDVPGTQFCTLDLREACEGREDPGCGRYEVGP